MAPFVRCCLTHTAIGLAVLGRARQHMRSICAHKSSLLNPSLGVAVNGLLDCSMATVCAGHLMAGAVAGAASRSATAPLETLRLAAMAGRSLGIVGFTPAAYTTT